MQHGLGVHGRGADEPRAGRRVVQQAGDERDVRVERGGGRDGREGPEHGADLRDVVEQAGHGDVALGERREVVARDEAEVGRAALERAVQVRVRRLRGVGERAVGQDDLGEGGGSVSLVFFSHVIRERR